MRERPGHVTEEQIRAFTEGKLTKEEEQTFLIHVGSCDYCAEQFSGWLEQDLLEPPAYLQEEILERSRCADVRAVKTASGLSRNMRLFLYSLKVGLAVAASLYVLFFSSGIGGLEIPVIRIEQEMSGSITETLDEKSEKANGRLRELTRSLFGTEYEEENDD